MVFLGLLQERTFRDYHRDPFPHSLLKTSCKGFKDP